MGVLALIIEVVPPMMVPLGKVVLVKLALFAVSTSFLDILLCLFEANELISSLVGILSISSSNEVLFSSSRGGETPSSGHCSSS